MNKISPKNGWVGIAQEEAPTQKNSPSTTSTLPKVATLALCVFLIGQISPAYPKAAGVAGTALALTNFPKHLARGMHPGFFTTKDGGSYCRYVPGTVIPVDECDLVAKQMSVEIKEAYPERFLLMLGSVSLHNKGFEVAMLKGHHLEGVSKIRRFTFGNNPSKYTNYQNGLKFLEKEVLQNPQFLLKTPNQVIETIHKTHKLILKNFPVAEVGKKGEFRREHLLVKGDHVGGKFEDFVEELKKVGTESDVRKFKSSYKKLMSVGGDLGRALGTWTKAELEAWKKIVHFGVLPPEIPKEMETFAATLLEKLCFMVNEGGDPVETAAWAHQEFGRIHPYVDGNGRLARALMNTILQMGGIEAVVFPDDDAYTRAVQSDQQIGGGAFTHFLAEMIEWNRAYWFV